MRTRTSCRRRRGARTGSTICPPLFVHLLSVYFSCHEALQNVAKHGGRGARAVVTLWEAGLELCFEVRDSGVGFDPEQARRGSGLTNIRDRR